MNMKQILLGAAVGLCLVAGVAMCREGRAQPVHLVPLTDVEIESQQKLNSLACKSIGLDDGGQVCAMGQALNNKMNQARQPKPEPKKEP